MGGELAYKHDYEPESIDDEFEATTQKRRHLELVGDPDGADLDGLESTVIPKPSANPEFQASGSMTPLALLARDAQRYPLLNSKAKEHDLAKRIEKGDLIAKDILIGSNIRLTMSNAKRYVGQGLDYEDLVQEGVFGLIRAAEKFDWRKDFKFSTYATWWIRQACGRAVMTKSKTMRVPTHIAQDLLALHNAETALTLKLAHEPTETELAENTKFDIHQIKELREVDRRVISLNIPTGDGKNRAELGELMAGEEDTAAEAENNIFEEHRTKEVQEVLGRLSVEDVKLLENIYGLNGKPALSTAEIARRLNISPEAVRKREKRVLRLAKGLGGKYLADAAYEPVN